MFLNVPLNILINYYWIVSPIFLFFSGEITMTTFGILSIRYSQINNIIILLICTISSFLTEQLLFLLPRYKKNYFNKYHDNNIYQFIVNSDHSMALIIFIISRFVPVVRIICPIALGFSTMSTWLFSLVNLLASLGWCGSFYYLGRHIGKKTIDLNWKIIIELVEKKYLIYKNKLFYILLILLLIFVVYHFYKVNNLTNKKL